VLLITQVTRAFKAGVIRQPLQNISNSGRTRIQRPKTPLDFSQRMPFTGKRYTSVGNMKLYQYLTQVVSFKTNLPHLTFHLQLLKKKERKIKFHS
jgi:hypothetical protein